MAGWLRFSPVNKGLRGLALCLAFILSVCQIPFSPPETAPVVLAPPSEVQTAVLAVTESGKRLAAWVKSLTSPGAETLNWFYFTAHPQSLVSLTPNEKQLVRERKLIKSVIFVDNESTDDWRDQINIEPADSTPIEGPLYVISDVHLSGEKEAGMDPGKYQQLLDFLDAVAREGRTLVINGDFIELNLEKSELFNHLRTVYAKLRKIKRVIYLRGNHDEVLASFVGKRWKNITFLDSMSIRFDNEIVHIEHGHKSDYPWHHDGRGGGRLILLDAWLKLHGIPLQLWWTRISSWLKFLFFPSQLTQLLMMHKRLKQLRGLFGMLTSLLWFPFDLIWDLCFKKNEPTLHYVIGHYHEVDKWLFDTVFFSILAWVTQRSRTRVKLHFTAGGWENYERSPLRYTLITPDGAIERCNVADLIAVSKARRLRIPISDEPLFAASL